MPKQAEKARNGRDAEKERDRRKRDDDKDRSRSTSRSEASRDGGRSESRSDSKTRSGQRRGRTSTADLKVTAKNLTSEERQWLNKNKGQLSRTTLRAKWLHDPDEHEDRAGQSLATRSHDVIKQWAEARGGVPATVPGTEHDDRPGVLRFMFNDGGDDTRRGRDRDDDRGRSEGDDGRARNQGEGRQRRGTRRLEEISWERWFETFDERGLVFVFQEHLKRGDDSNFFRFDSPQRENE